MSDHEHDWYLQEGGDDEPQTYAGCSCGARLDVLDIERILDAHDILVAACEENMQKRHDYGMWIARLEQQPPSHTDPIEGCLSPGCRKNREAIRKAKP